MTLPVFILAHLYAITLMLGAFLLAVLSYALGVNSRPIPRRHPGGTGVLIELGYIADIPIAYLVDAGDAVTVAKWLDMVREGVAVRV